MQRALLSNSRLKRALIHTPVHSRFKSIYNPLSISICSRPGVLSVTCRQYASQAEATYQKYDATSDILFPVLNKSAPPRSTTKREEPRPLGSSRRTIAPLAKQKSPAASTASSNRRKESQNNGRHARTERRTKTNNHIQAERGGGKIPSEETSRQGGHRYLTSTEAIDQHGLGAGAVSAQVLKEPKAFLTERCSFRVTSSFASRGPNGSHHCVSVMQSGIGDGRTFTGYGAGLSPKLAEFAASLHILGQLNHSGLVEQFAGTAYDSKVITEKVLLEEVDSKREIYEYCAAYNGLPEYNYRKISHNKQLEIVLTFSPQNIRVVCRKRDPAIAEALAGVLFKQQAEKWHAENAESHLQVKDALSLNTDNAKKFFEFCKIQKKVGKYDFAPLSGTKISATHTSGQIVVDGEAFGQLIHSVKKKNTESIAYLAAAVKLRELQPHVYSDFIEALKIGKGDLLKPVPPLWFRARWDHVAPMVDTVNVIRRIGIPRSTSETSPNNNTKSMTSGNSQRNLTSPNAESLSVRNRHLQASHTKYQASDALSEMRRKRAELPMNQYAAQVLDLVEKNPVSIVVGATGSGKTTQVPQIIFEHAIKQDLGATCNIICTQPRRIAATSVAERVAAERNESLRETVGYHVRFNAKTAPPYGSINFCTTGILLQQLRHDSNAALHGITHILIDEVHERDIQIDFLLILLKRILTNRMKANLPSIKLVLMSATMNTELFANYFGLQQADGKVIHCPSISVPGRTFPVTEHFLSEIEQTLRKEYSPSELSLLQDPTTREYLDAEARYISHTALMRKSAGGSTEIPGATEDDTFIDWKSKSIFGDDGEVRVNDKVDSLTPCGLAAVVIAHLAKTTDEGDILVFLPGLAEIQKVHEMLSTSSPLKIDFTKSSRFQIDILHSSLPQQQMDVFQKTMEGRRRIILSTNIAETSVTIPEVRYVVDSGKLREKQFEQSSRITKLQSTWISKSNSKQRAGRAGRVRNGNYFALFTKERSKDMKPTGLPEMLRSDLQEICLDIKAQGFTDSIAQFLSEAIEPPTPVAIQSSLTQLRGLGALDKDENLTTLGRVLATMPVEPALGKMILLGVIFRCLDPMILLGAAGASRDIFVSPLDKKKVANEVKASLAGDTGSDQIALITAIRRWRLKRDTEGQHAAYGFTEQNFLHRGALQIIDQTANQIEEILVKTGIIPYLPSKERFRSEIGHPSLNDNSSSVPLIKALSLAGTYPNIGVNVSGSRGFRTAGENFAMIHPSSINYPRKSKDDDFPFGTVVSFGTKAKSDGNSVFLKDTTINTLLNAVLFGGRPSQAGRQLLFDGWFPVEFQDERIMKAVIQFRLVLDKVLNHVFENMLLRQNKSGTSFTDNPLQSAIADGLVEVLEKFPQPLAVASMGHSNGGGGSSFYRNSSFERQSTSGGAAKPLQKGLESGRSFLSADRSFRAA